MERKTMGAFIAALRKSKGYTQRELAEMLNVSDKAVSRWERDESYPDLLLIPVIADIFGVTSDELLRGERHKPETPQAVSGSVGAEKRRRVIAKRVLSKFKMRSFISVGLGLAGLLAAAICNLVFLRGLLGFWLLCAFVLAGSVCQCVFTASAWNAADSDETDADTVQMFKKALYNRSFAVFAGLLVCLCFGAPLLQLWNEPYYGLEAGETLRGALIASVVLVVCFLARNIIAVTSKTLAVTPAERYNSGLKLKLTAGLIAAVLLTTGVLRFIDTNSTSWFNRGTTFETAEEFIVFAGTEKSYTPAEPPTAHPTDVEQGEPPTTSPADAAAFDEADASTSRRESMDDEDGNELFSWTWNNDEISLIVWGDADNGYMPATVYTTVDVQHAIAVMHIVYVAFGCLYAAELAFAFVLYFKKRKK